MNVNRKPKHSLGAKHVLSQIVALSMIAASVFPAFAQQTNTATSGQASGFRLCGNDCGASLYYVGLSRSNSATAQGQTNASPIGDERIYRNVSNLDTVLPLPSTSLRNVGVQGVEFASSRYEITANRIGFSQKSEDLTAISLDALSEVKAGARLLWGDSFRVSSRTLARGTPVRVEITRTVGGAGSASDFAFYWVATETYYNRDKLVGLNYTIARAPGGADVIVGDAVETQTIRARVGDVFTIESLLSIIDGVEGKANSSQFLTGAFDSVGYEIRLDPSAASTAQACLKSFSGTYISGNCS
jgi:hypothetical protein